MTVERRQKPRVAGAAPRRCTWSVAINTLVVWVRSRYVETDQLNAARVSRAGKLLDPSGLGFDASSADYGAATVASHATGRFLVGYDREVSNSNNTRLFTRPMCTPAASGPCQSNAAPTADAGSDQTVDEGATVELDDSNSSDPDGDSLDYEWTQTSGPDVTLRDAATETPTFTAPEVSSRRDLVFELVVDDGAAESPPPPRCSSPSATPTAATPATRATSARTAASRTAAWRMAATPQRPMGAPTRLPILVSRPAAMRAAVARRKTARIPGRRPNGSDRRGVVVPPRVGVAFLRNSSCYSSPASDCSWADVDYLSERRPTLPAERGALAVSAERCTGER